MKMTDYHVPVQTNVPVATPFTNEIPEAPITDEMKDTYSLSKTTKFLCAIDFVFSFLYAFYNPYFFIPLVISAIGYWGAKNYKLCPIFFYLVYTFIINITRVAVTITYYLHTNDPSIQMYKVVDILITILVFLLGIWIMRIIYKFYSSVKNLSEDELYILRNMRRTIIVRTIYY